MTPTTTTTTMKTMVQEWKLLSFALVLATCCVCVCGQTGKIIFNDLCDRDDVHVGNFYINGERVGREGVRVLFFHTYSSTHTCAFQFK